MPPSRTQSPSVLGLVLAAALGAACSSEPATIPEIELHARDFSFALPDTIQGGLVHVHFINDGAEPHHAQFIRLNPGVSRSQFDSVWTSIMQAVPTEGESAFFRVFDYASLSGGPSVIDPGLRADVILDLPAGDYVLMCFIASPDGVPHIAKGMRHWLAVTDPPSDQPAPPTADGRVDLADFQFRDVPAMDSGQVVLEVTNSGTEPHEMAVVRLDGISFDDALPMLIGPSPEDAPSGPSPLRPVGGMQGIMPGQHAWAMLDLEPGNYMLICFIPSPANEGKPHAVLGMARPFTVG